MLRQCAPDFAPDGKRCQKQHEVIDVRKLSD